VAAVVGIQPGGGAGPVGDEGVVAPGGKELGLVALVADATDDQPVALPGGLGDLGDPVGLVGDRGTQAASGRAAIAARTVLVWRTVIE
jgi:hypothetical protein